METDSDASWIFVCDGLNTHKSESLVQFVAEQCNIPDELGRLKSALILKFLLHNKINLQSGGYYAKENN